MSGLIEEMQRVVKTVVNDDNQARQIVYELIKQFGGLNLYMPRHDYASRNSEMVALFKAGAGIKALALRYRVSEKTVYRILRHLKT